MQPTPTKVSSGIITRTEFQSYSICRSLRRKSAIAGLSAPSSPSSMVTVAIPVQTSCETTYISSSFAMLNSPRTLDRPSSMASGSRRCTSWTLLRSSPPGVQTCSIEADLALSLLYSWTMCATQRMCETAEPSCPAKADATH